MSTFQTFGTQHWLAVSATIVLSLVMPVIGVRLASLDAQNKFAKLIAVCMAAYIFVGLVIRLVIFDLPVNLNLPLHLCSGSIILGALMLWLRSHQLYEIVYFWGIGGALAALATPDIQQSFPHPLFLLFFVGHGLALTCVFYAIMVFKFRPRWQSVFIAISATAILALFIYPINLILDANYLYLIRKPSNLSPIDLFDSWSWYIVGLVILAITVCFLCYLPFFIYDQLKLRKRK